MSNLTQIDTNCKMFTEVEVIDPQKAEEYLAKNFANNRPIKKNCINAYARDMANGKWKLINNGIAFDELGRLVDGQNRLHAVIKSGASVLMNVTRNMPVDSVVQVDIGSKRELTDAVKIAGLSNSVLSNPAFVSMMRQTIVFEAGYVVPTFDDIMNFYNAFEKEVRTVQRCAPSNSFPVDGSVRAGYLAAIISGVDEQVLYAFNQAFQYGKVVGEYNTTAAMMLRNYFANARIKHLSISRRAKYHAVQNAIYWFCKEKGYRAKLDAPRYEIREAVINALKGEDI